MNQRRRRMCKLEAKLQAVPAHPATVRAAFKQFRETGELPEDDRVARAVIHRVILGPKIAELHDRGADEATILRAVVCTPEQAEDEVMEALWLEAIDAPWPLRGFARAALRGLTANGVDPTTRAFAALGFSPQLPNYGSVGMFVLGYPQSFATAPYKRQARRLFARADKLRQRINQNDRRWFDTFGQALCAFLDLGELPDDDLLRDAVLVSAEVEALMLHSLGSEVADCMAAFDTAARATGPDRDIAIASLQQFAAEHRFRESHEDQSIHPSIHAAVLHLAGRPSLAEPANGPSVFSSPIPNWSLPDDDPPLPFPLQ
jgi:hypothetical protein